MRVALILMSILTSGSIAMSDPQSGNVVGTWNVELAFANNEHRSLRFEALPDGKGTLVSADPQSKVWSGSKPSDAQWTRSNQTSITFSGPVEFLIGNVGRDAGKLTCRGKFETPDSITGEADFLPLVGERPSKLGTFKAVRSKK